MMQYIHYFIRTTFNDDHCEVVLKLLMSKMSYTATQKSASV